MAKRTPQVIFLCLLLSLTASAQKREKYEFIRNLPVYADSLIADLTYPLAWGNSDIQDFDVWKQVARQKVFDCMLTPPPAPAKGCDVKVIYEEQRDGYKARKIEVKLSKYYSVPAYVLIPDGKGPFPAINVLHDHGAHLFIGKEKMIRPLACEDSTVIKDAEEWLKGYEGQFFGDYLAQHGYVVFSADAPMWGERGQEEGPRRNMYDMIAGNMMMYGIDLCSYMTYDDIAGTEYLASMPEVDPERIGCTGWSMGAYRAWMLSALSNRIKVGTAVCWMVTSDEQLKLSSSHIQNGGFANCIPGLRRWLDYPHIASIACPKPMLFINGSQDKLFPVAGVEKAFKMMHDTWDSQGAGDKLETELWDMPHSCGKNSQKRVLDFFEKHLKPMGKTTSDSQTLSPVEIGDQILLYQRATGGWPKNIDMAKPLTDKERKQIVADKQKRDDSTIDNGATTTQMIFLARLYQQTKEKRFRDGFRQGVEYLLSGQYENGGWPQFWPQMRDYQIHITYNDNAMVNTMNLLRDVVDQKEPYQGNLTDKSLRQRAKIAFDKGVECILATQIVTDGELTVWCQQHDRVTLKPAKARAYELPSYCSAESAAITMLLMQLPNPDERVKRAVHAAMRWFDKHKITGYRLVRTGTRGSVDYDTRLVKDSTAEPIWARFYDLEHCEPYVCDRDGVPRRYLHEIGSERRNGYSWYNNRPAMLFPVYEAWKK